MTMPKGNPGAYKKPMMKGHCGPGMTGCTKPPKVKYPNVGKVASSKVPPGRHQGPGT